MGLDKIIKAPNVAGTAYDYKAREISTGVSNQAKSYINQESLRAPDFKISNLVAKQSGISKLENEALQDKVNAQVLERLKDVQEKGYQEGYDLGLLEGTEKAFQENKSNLDQGVKMLETVLKSLEVLKESLLLQNEEGLIRLIFLIAKKIAMRDLEENRGAAWEILKAVIGEMQSDEKIVVNHSHEDLYFIQTLQEKSGKGMESLERVKFVSDDSVKSGGCLIHTEYGTVDATVEERVERTWQALLERIPKQQNGSEGPK